MRGWRNQEQRRRPEKMKRGRSPSRPCLKLLDLKDLLTTLSVTSTIYYTSCWRKYVAVEPTINRELLSWWWSLFSISCSIRGLRESANYSLCTTRNRRKDSKLSGAIIMMKVLYWMMMWLVRLIAYLFYLDSLLSTWDLTDLPACLPACLPAFLLPSF